MLNQKSQTQVEFILAVFLFFVVVLFLFISLFLRMPAEIGKISQQSACLRGDALSNLILLETGIPSDWNASTIQKFGLGNGTFFYISAGKINSAKQAGYVSIWNKTELNTSFHISYGLYAFAWKNDTYCNPANATAICRQENILGVYAGAFLPATLRLDLFFPFENITNLSSNSLETSDSSSTIYENNGTSIMLSFKTNATDRDSINITLNTLPNLIYIKNMEYKTNGSTEFSIYIGNTSAKDSFGSANILPKNVCEKERRLLLAGFGGEAFPAQFDIKTW